MFKAIRARKKTAKPVFMSREQAAYRQAKTASGIMFITSFLASGTLMVCNGASLLQGALGGLGCAIAATSFTAPEFARTRQAYKTSLAPSPK